MSGAADDPSLPSALDQREQQQREANDAGDDAMDEGEDGDDEDEDEESSEEEELTPKVLPQRSTRGVRLTNTSGEGDDEFWSQDFFADAAEADEDYDQSDASRDEEPDVVDSDFDEDESESDEEEVEVEREKKGRKAGAYVDPKLQAQKRAAAAKKAAATKAARKAAAADAASSTGGVDRKADGSIDTGAAQPVTFFYDEDSGFPSGSDAAPQRRRGGPTAPLGSYAARKSIRSATMEKTMELARREAESEKRRASQKPKPKITYRLLTQEEQLRQSVETEKENEKSLALLLKIEEEKKKEAAPKARVQGDRILVRSFRNEQGLAQTIVAFSSGELPDFLQPHLPAPSMRHASCVITSAPARYIDPQTGLPFASVEALRSLRERNGQMIRAMQAAVEAGKQAALQQMANEASISLPASASALPASRKRKHEEGSSFASSPLPPAAPAGSPASLPSASPPPVPGSSPASLSSSPADESPKASKTKKARTSKAPAKTKK